MGKFQEGEEKPIGSTVGQVGSKLDLAHKDANLASFGKEWFTSTISHHFHISKCDAFKPDNPFLRRHAVSSAKRVIEENEAAARDIVQLFTNGWTPQQQAREEVLQKQLDPVSLRNCSAHTAHFGESGQ
jgi:hypothetical protein